MENLPNRAPSLSESHWLFDRALYGFAGSVAIATLLGFLGHLWWVLGLLDHLRLQYSFVLLVALGWGIWHRHRWVWLCLIPLAVNISLLMPLLVADGGIHDSSAPRLRILHANLDRDNTAPTTALKYLNQQMVDLLFVQEVTPVWLDHLQQGLSSYRLIRAQPMQNSHGSALFVLIASPSPQPIAILNTQIIHLPATSDRPLLETRIRWANQELAILSLHVIRPRNAGTAAYQQVEFAAVAAWSQLHHRHDRQVIVIGDFNTTPWSAPFRQLLQQSTLLNSQRGFGVQPTWLAGTPNFLMIPIDHCLHSPSLKTVERQVGNPIGSDHLPLFVELIARR